MKISYFPLRISNCQVRQTFLIILNLSLSKLWISCKFRLKIKRTLQNDFLSIAGLFVELKLRYNGDEIKFLTVGKLKEKYLKIGSEYIKSLVDLQK